jgi:AcrR family transcriptional regulator
VSNESEAYRKVARQAALREVAVAGNGDAAGVRTPWGLAGELRRRRGGPGRRSTPEALRRSQRERLFGALVAISSEKGYEATRIADLVKLAGVSRATFYEHFEDKEECLLATVEAVIGPTLEIVKEAEDAPTSEERMRQAVVSFLDLVAVQPAAAKLCFIEIYAAGQQGEEQIERALDVFEDFGVAQLNKLRGRKGMPRQMVRAMIGGLLKVVQKRLYSDKAKELPELAGQIADWWLSYPAPPGPLEAPRRRGRKAKPFADRQAVAHPPERVLRALAATVADRGYKATTVAEVVDRAQTSQRVFYGHFDNKEEALLAALDSGSAQMLAAVLPAFRRADSWQESVRAAYEAMLAFGIEEPEYTQLGAVEMYTAGRRALQTRDAVMAGLEELLMPGFELAPQTPPIAPEAIGGAIYALINQQVKTKGPESMPELVPMATYITLAPFVGAKDAYERATEEQEKW